jgi:hypothetical protein
VSQYCLFLSVCLIPVCLITSSFLHLNFVLFTYIALKVPSFYPVSSFLIYSLPFKFVSVVCAIFYFILSALFVFIPVFL